MAMVTDYDCWYAGHDDVTVEQVVAVIHQNADNAAAVVRAAIAAMPDGRTCACASALQYAVMTSHEQIPAETKKRLALVIGKYIS
jgi:5'-methylthioadenosine phosphorylase